MGRGGGGGGGGCLDILFIYRLLEHIYNLKYVHTSAEIVPHMGSVRIFKEIPR